MGERRAEFVDLLEVADKINIWQINFQNGMKEQRESKTSYQKSQSIPAPIIQQKNEQKVNTFARFL
ncbi:hypothetical protein [Rossellomorea sp. DUT-2]|uniref:hypothetical protein n=1 Tax=Rossellomorea sp. DUT-2 TaxID=3412021 RepID=UPI003D1852F5